MLLLQNLQPSLQMKEFENDTTFSEVRYKNIVTPF